MGLVLLSSTTITASGQSSWVALSKNTTYMAVVKVTAVSGTSPSLSINLQEQDPITGSARNVGGLVNGLASITAVGNYIIVSDTPLSGNVRVAYSVSGTSPSFTGDMA